MAITWGDIELRLKWIHKRDVFLCSSLFGLCVLFSITLNDFFQVTFLQDTVKTSQKWAMSILVLHTFSFYLALLSFIYTTQSANRTRTRVALALCSILGNFVVFVMRVVFEVTFQNCRQEVYRLVTQSGK